MNCDIKNTILIITGCIKPNVEQGFLLLKDVDERLRQYVDSIVFYIKESTFKGIVFCENSNYPYNKIDELQHLACMYGKSFEWLSFSGDNKKVVAFNNKGLGEDEIMNYICENSQLYALTDSFAKVTGRLHLININQLMDFAVGGKNYFYRDIYRGRTNKALDTRFYIITKSFYENHVRNCYERVGNLSLCYEKVFFRLIQENEYSLLNAYPHFIGQSSGDGKDYGKIKSSYMNILDFLCKYNLFNRYFILINLCIRIRRKILKIFF